MGILAALDYHHRVLQGERPDHYEVEYRLVSWGEVFPPFLGDREHSVAARFILRDFPFKLFSSSTPYDAPLPQQLTLTFRAPHETRHDAERLHASGVYPDEIADEFAAFLSLVTRRRIFISRRTRYDDLPIEETAHIYSKAQTQEPQALKEVDPQAIYSLLESLRVIDREVAEGILLAIRLYHTAIHLMYSEPEFAYLLLVTSLEAASSAALQSYKPADEEYLDARFPRWRDYEHLLPNNERASFREFLLTGEHYTFRKLLRFLEAYVPDAFWDTSVDDAKPDYLIGIVGQSEGGKGKVTFSHSEKALRPYEVLHREHLPAIARSVYTARSDLVHSGKRFPPSIVLGHFRLVPSEAVEDLTASALSGDPAAPLPVPPLLTFERMVSSALANFLARRGM